MTPNHEEVFMTMNEELGAIGDEPMAYGALDTCCTTTLVGEVTFE